MPFVGVPSLRSRISRAGTPPWTSSGLSATPVSMPGTTARVPAPIVR